MMFTDIVDSTRIKKLVGDDPYFAALTTHNTLIRDCLKDSHGDELKTIGDSFFAGFSHPREAVACAIEIQKRLASSPIHIDKETLSVRIGMHTGTPKVYRDPVSGRTDLSGTDVDKAARVESLARGGQILISAQTKSIAEPAETHDWGRWEMKGLGPQDVFEVLWPGRSAQMPTGRMWREPVRFLTNFVGRQREVDELIEMVKRERLVTVRATGGIGKTRVADETARRMSAQFEDGAAFVELAAVRNTEQALVSELVARFEVRTEGFKDEAAAVVSAFRNREMLLVLDNFEAVMAGAPLLGEVLRECPALHLLLTSQQATSVDGEQLYSLLPMAVPPEKTSVTLDTLRTLDAFDLFRERAIHARADWKLTDDNFGTVAEILELTEGIPLAIELAVARLRSLQLSEIRDGLKRDRLEFLRRRGGGKAPRQASMEASLEWSFGLLKPKEQALFAALSVFRGGFFVEDARQVCECEDAAELIESLREASLVESSESIDGVRCRMLQVVREYAAEKLGAPTEPLRRRHVDHFLRILTHADEQLSGSEHMKGFARIDTDYENILAGVESSRALQEHRVTVAYVGRLIGYLSNRARFTQRLMLAEQALGAALASNDSDRVAGSQNNLGNAYLELPTGDRRENLKRSIGCYQEALRVYNERDSPIDWAMTQNNLGVAYASIPTDHREENLRLAITCYEAALRFRTEGDFPREWGETQNNLGAAYSDFPTGDRADNQRRAIGYFEAALRVRPEGSLDWAITQNNLGVAYRKLDGNHQAANLRRAIECHEAALRVCTERDFPFDWATTHNHLGNAYANLPTGDRGDNLRRAIEYYRRTLRVYAEQHFPREWANAQYNLGHAYKDLAAGGGAGNLNLAVASYEAAARGYTAAGISDEAKEALEQAAALEKQLG